MVLVQTPNPASQIDFDIRSTPSTRASAEAPSRPHADLIVSYDSKSVIFSDNPSLQLTDHVYAKAKVEEAKTVMLWLGANVMLEYSLEEASTLLSGQRDKCSEMLEEAREKGQWLKNQITVAEVLIARIYNWDIQKKKEGGK